MNETKRKEKFWVLVPAAGIGKRMGSEIPKQYLSIAGRSILAWTLERMEQLDKIEQIVLILHPQEKLRQTDTQQSLLPTPSKIMTVAGGEERFNSVLNGLISLQSRAEADDWVLVHDAVRPCVAVSDIEKLIAALANDPVGGLLANSVIDTLKLSSLSEGAAQPSVSATLDRENYWLAATPQMFRYGLLCEALEHAVDNGLQITDEASAMEVMGHKVKLVAGRSDNIKVTHASDLPLVEFLLNQQLQTGSAHHAS